MSLRFLDVEASSVEAKMGSQKTLGKRVRAVMKYKVIVDIELCSLNMLFVDGELSRYVVRMSSK